MPRSGIREVMELASGMADVIHLEVGEPSFTTPAHIIDAAAADAHRGFTRYTPNAGLSSLREAIARQASRSWGRPVAAGQVIVTAGAVSALSVAILALAEEGDEILLPDPGWPNYASIAALARARPTYYPLHRARQYLPDVRELSALITPRTKALLINNPSNPTGVVFPPDVVRDLVALAKRHDLYVISDEVYEALVFNGTHTSAAAFDDGRVITISGCSKTYAMTGWRLGYAIADPKLVTLMAKLQEPLVSCASAVSQRAAEAALNGPQDCVSDMRAAYQRRRDLACEILVPSGLLATVPHGAFYALVDLQSLGLSGRELAVRLLQEERVATAPGDTFGVVSDGMLRISLAATEADLTEGCNRIRAFAARHAGRENESKAIASAV